MLNFNPRSREGSDAELRNSPVYLRNFNPRSREGSDFESFDKVMAHNKFQSALPRGERPHLLMTVPARFFISIRAPARGATITSHGSSRSGKYFNPRSREGSDTLSSLRVMTFSYFNPRSREGSDRMQQEIERFLRISIRAPARGATEESAADAAASEISIRAPARGATDMTGNITQRQTFQSALPRGERLFVRVAI